jgi:hypothetical protein
MRIQWVEDALLIRYLLGDLSESDQVAVEDRAFAESEYLGALEAAEADLIDTYVRGGLLESDRRAFERQFLNSPNRRRKVEFARALAVVATESLVHPRTRPSLRELFRGSSPLLRFAAGFAMVFCLVGGFWLIYQNTAMRSQISALESRRRELETQRQRLERQLGAEQSRALSPKAPDQESAGSTRFAALLVLAPGLSRSEARTEELVLRPSTTIAHIRIQLEPRDDYPHFRAELRTRRGDEVVTAGNLVRRQTSAGYTVSFDVPASALAPGDYELALKGTGASQGLTDIGFYYFRVRKE